MERAAGFDVGRNDGPPAVVVVALVLLVLVLVRSPTVAAQPVDRCAAVAGEIVSVEGTVERSGPDPAAFEAARLGDRLCVGDRVRTGPSSRAEVALANESILRLDEGTVLSLRGAEPERRSLIEMLTGAVYFFSHRPRSLRIDTPFVNAGTEGTELLVRVGDERTEIVVFDGRVIAENASGELGLGTGDAAVATAATAPQPATIIRPRDRVAWAIHYPPVLTPLAAGEGGALPPASAAAARAVGRGDHPGALAALDRVPPADRDARHEVYRAGVLLGVGRVEAAEDAIGRALARDPGNADALAQRAILRLARSDLAGGLEDSARAVDLDPASAAARIARSYALQGAGRIDDARDGLLEATEAVPGDALVLARLAEMELARGDPEAAREAAARAVALAPNLARTQTVLGYAELLANEPDVALERFDAAIGLDQGDPLPRLGRGLATIRGGELEAGRREIEIAVGLDPDDAVLRSYLGKAFFEERRDPRAADQLQIAKELDPNDPTPWFYDAVRKQLENRPVEALHDLQTAIDLNDNRAVYRSSLLLDQDLAARGASLARIYDDLGFDQRALLEGWRSVNLDPGNHSAHRFLADAYAVLPRHEVARVSELLQSQLRQPLNTTPIQPQLAESNLQVIAGAGPATPSFTEFSPLFLADGVSVLADGVVGSNETLGEDVIASAIVGRYSVSVGQYHFESDGTRPNNDLEQDIVNAFAQVQLPNEGQVQVELRQSEFDRGDLPLRFDPMNFSDTIRQEDTIRSLRIGHRHVFKPSADLIANLQIQEGEFDAEVPGVSEVEDEQDGLQLELQHLNALPALTLVAGGGVARVERTRDLFVEPAFDPPPTEEDIRHDNLYGYTYIDLFDAAQLTLGASADLLDGAVVERDQLNPKLGLLWPAWPGGTVRAAAFRTLTRTLLSSQTIEPTQVAGFNQFFDDAEGTDAWRYGAAVEQNLTGLTGAPAYVGLEASHRDLEVSGIVPFPAPRVVSEDFEEDLVRAYANWAPHPWWAVSLDYFYESFERGGALVGPEEFTDLDTHKASLGLRFAHPSGLRASGTIGFVAQDGTFSTPMGGTAPGEDEFVVLDASLGYRLPGRHGLITLLAKNLLDEGFQFQDTDPARPRIVPERQVFLRASLFF